MKNSLPKKVQESIKKTVYEKADKFGYIGCDRVKNGEFIDLLVEDSEVGSVLTQYLPKERVRTYIKDGILNAYAKEFTRKALATSPPEEVIRHVYGKTAHVIHKATGKMEGLFILRSEDGLIFVVSGGTVLKWETALRKALDIIAQKANLTVGGLSPSICLKLSPSRQELTDSDKKHIVTALKVIGVNVLFCDL